MTEKKRFYKAYCCGDTGVIDGLENEWFIENINSISDLKENWDTVIDKLNQVAEENEQLKLKVNGLKSELSIWKEDANEHIKEINKLFEENKQLKQQNEQAIDLILDGIMEMHDGKRNYAETLFNKAIISLRQLREKFE